MLLTQRCDLQDPTSVRLSAQLFNSNDISGLWRYVEMTLSLQDFHRELEASVVSVVPTS